ncbi:MAG: YbaK/EbsC family protein [Prolixibacteraceae bacterium]|nr:YbaK/EbsC family protein [Prolixibacteraceae bacterium]
MPVKKLKAFLDEKKVKYVSISHSKAYTSQEVAALTHISGKEMAKTVLIKIDGELAMTVLPASYRIDFEMLRTIMKTRKVTLAGEMEFKDRFPDCEIGAMPPFGNLYDMDVYVAESLAEDEEIAFSAGLHSEIIKMKYRDFDKLVKPHILKFSEKTISFPNDPGERWDVD